MLYIFMYNIHLSTCHVVSQLQLTCFQHTNGIHTKLERHSVERIYLRQWSFNASKVQNHTSQQAADNHAQYLYVGFSWCNKIQNVAVHAISEKVIRFQHPDYDPGRAQKLISSYMSRHLSTRHISSTSIHAFLSNLSNTQTDRQTPLIAFTSSAVGGNHCIWNVFQ